MAVVGPRVMPLSQFLGWSQMDQEAQLGWRAHEARRCPECGHHPDEEPRHWHVDVCTSCSQRAALVKEAAGVRGAHVVAVAGKKADCPRCKAELEADLANRSARRRASSSDPDRR